MGSRTSDQHRSRGGLGGRHPGPFTEVGYLLSELLRRPHPPSGLPGTSRAAVLRRFSNLDREGVRIDPGFLHVFGHGRIYTILSLDVKTPPPNLV